MIDLAALETGLAAFVKDFSGLEQAAWENANRGFTKETYALLSWVSSTSKGVAETTHDSAGTPTTTDHQRWSLQVAVESMRQSPNSTAQQAAEVLRLRCHTPRATAALAALGLALAFVGDARNADYNANQRMVQRWVLELRMNTVSSFTDTGFSESVIEHVALLSNTVNTPANVPVATSLQQNEEVP